MERNGETLLKRDRSGPAETAAAVKLLLVEDDSNDLEFARLALKKRSLAEEMGTARDGEEALNFISGCDAETLKELRVVILDLKLPRVNGLEVLRRIKSDDRTRLVPVVIFTSSAEDRDITQSYALGANSYVVKPIDFESFDETVAAVASYWLNLNTPPPGP